MTRAGSVRSTLRALPTLLRIGVAETIAYRAEFLIWMLTTTMPLVMLALWTSVAHEGPFRGYDSQQFVAYYLLALIVRNLTSSWVVWQINDEVRRGVLSMRLLRPVHPFVAYSATHLSAVPLRGLVVFPVAIILLLTSARDVVTGDPTRLALLAPSLALAWALTFALMLAIGALAFFFDKSMAVMDVYFGVFAVLSGYLLPLPLLPDWLGDIARYAPFRYLLSAPIELVTRPDLTTGGALGLVGAQLAWATAMGAIALALWNAGVRRFEAVGA
jgi:ABC-2 type transport system permease protein